MFPSVFCTYSLYDRGRNRIIQVTLSNADVPKQVMAVGTHFHKAAGTTAVAHDLLQSPQQSPQARKDAVLPMGEYRHSHNLSQTCTKMISPHPARLSHASYGAFPAKA